LSTALLGADAGARAKTSQGYTVLDYAKANRGLESTAALKRLEEESR